MRIIDVKSKFKSKFLSMYEIIYKAKNGTEKKWMSSSRKSVEELEKYWKTDKLSSPDAVVIVPYHEKSKKLVLIEEYRVPVDDFVLSFPAGLIDEGEGIREAAKRELWEETGLRLTDLYDLNTVPTFMSPGMTDESASILMCKCSGKPSDENLEESEDIKTILVDKDEAKKILNSRRVMDTKVLLILTLFVNSDYFERKKYYTYMISCNDGSIYTGYTTDINRRIEEHKSGINSKYTRARGYNKLEALFSSDTKSIAMSLESKLKRISREKKQRIINDNELVHSLMDGIKIEKF